jgi:hypothetical protein
MAASSPVSDESVTPADSSRVAIRVAESADSAAITAFRGDPRLHYLCLGHRAPCGGGAAAAPQAALSAVIASNRAGQIVAAGWLEPLPGDTSAAFVSLAVQGAYRGAFIEAALLKRLSAEARALRLTRLEACVARQTRDTLDHFRQAGLRVASSLCVGGVAEVTLDLG